MKPHNENEVIYYLTMADLQRVAEDLLNRSLTKNEIEKAIKKLPDYINWYESIDYTLREVIDR
jgi:hypothetical protein